MSYPERDPIARPTRRRPQEFRVESSKAAWGALWPAPETREALYADRTLAVTVAAKSCTEPGGTFQVVHVSSGEVIFRKHFGTAAELGGVRD
jgi:hypothetical protein